MNAKLFQRGFSASWVLSLLVLLILPAVVQAQFTFTTNSGAITITRYTGSDGAVTIPDATNGLPVTSIGLKAFFECTNVTRVTIGTNVTSIGQEAFQACTSLSAIAVNALNSSFSSVDGVLFDKNQTTLIQYPAGKAGGYTIPSSVSSIGDYAFANCTSLTNVTMSSNVTNIGSDAFISCTSLTNVTISTSVGTIGEQAFYNCTSLISVTIPASVTNIGYRAFLACTSLSAIVVDPLNPSYDSEDGALFTKNQTTLVQYPAGNSGGYTIPIGVTNIGDYAFYGCTSLTNVTISSGVTNIGNMAFFNCSSLTDVIITGSVTSIGYTAFAKCTSLTSVTIPGSVTSIGYGAFQACTSLSSVTVPASVSSIGTGPFQACTSLSAIAVDVLNSSYSSVDGVLFNKNQTELIQYPAGKAGGYTIPSSVMDIGDEAFSGCTSLTSVTIPGSVTNIEDYAFSDCTNQTGVYFQGNAPSVNWVVGGGFGGGRRGAGGGVDTTLFSGDNSATVYYLPGTTGWGSTFGGLPAVLWNPHVQTSDPSFGVLTNGFGFTITGSTNIPIVIEACVDLSNPAWTPLQTCTLTNGSLYFSDPQWTNYPGRFYRFRTP